MCRPLLPVLGACLIGDLATRAAGAQAFAPLTFAGLLILVGILQARRCWRPSIQVQGVGALPLAGLLLLASLRVSSAAAPQAPLRIGQWRSLYETAELVGGIDGQVDRFETTPGVLRDGEWVELLSTREASPPARGPVPPNGESRGEPPRKILPDEIRRLAPAAPSATDRIRKGLESWRSAALARIEGLRSPLTRGLAGALLLGDRGELSPPVTDLFTRTGTRHALAVSGLHVALVASLWIWPLGALFAALLARLAGSSGGPFAFGRRPAWFARREVWRVLLLLLFVPLAGAGAPVVRAALALALTQVARLLPSADCPGFERRADSLSLWALAGWLEWLAEPRAITSLSVQLSYVATLGLILMTPAISRGMRACLPAGGRVQETDRAGRRRHPALRIVAQRSIDFGLTGLAASVAANVATLPIVWWVFGEWSVAGPFATLALLPLLATFLGLAWLWLVIPIAPLEALLTWNAEAMAALLQVFDTLPGSPLPLPNRPLALLALAGGAALLAASRGGRWRRAWTRVSALAWGVALLPWWRGATGLELYVLDVGNGTAVVVRAPGEPCWIFDAGSRDRPRVARAALAPLLRELDVAAVAVALSHGDADHARSLPWVVERYPPSLWLGALPARLAERLPRDCARIDLARGRLEGRYGPARSPDLVWTLLRGLDGEGNEGSRSLELRWGDRSLLLCGDAEGDGLAAQLQANAIRGPYDLVLFPHHGSETAWLTPFLEAAQPREIWISCSGRPQIADELERRGLHWRATGSAGPLVALW